MFDVKPKAAHPKRVIKTTYTNERELLNDVLWLYNNGEGVDVDPCYSVGISKSIDLDTLEVVRL